MGLPYWKVNRSIIHRRLQTSSILVEMMTMSLSSITVVPFSTARPTSRQTKHYKAMLHSMRNWQKLVVCCTDLQLLDILHKIGVLYPVFRFVLNCSASTIKYQTIHFKTVAWLFIFFFFITALLILVDGLVKRTTALWNTRLCSKTTQLTFWQSGTVCGLCIFLFTFRWKQK